MKNRIIPNQVNTPEQYLINIIYLIQLFHYYYTNPMRMAIPALAKITFHTVITS